MNRFIYVISIILSSIIIYISSINHSQKLKDDFMDVPFKFSRIDIFSEYSRDIAFSIVDKGIL